MAEIILLPYNYLVDSSIRATLKIEWNNAIVIFDEAHNLESVAADASSFSLTTTDIAACISEMQQVIRLLENKVPDISLHANKKYDLETSGEMSPDKDICINILQALFALESRLDQIPLMPIQSMGSAIGKVLEGEQLVTIFLQSGFRAEQVRFFQKIRYST